MRLIAAMVKQTIESAPANIAARVNSQALFNCSVNAGQDFVIWDYDPIFPDASVRIYTSTDGRVKDGQEDKFDIERDGQDGVHNLVIKSVQMGLAARYCCGLATDGMSKCAHLVAVGMTTRNCAILCHLIYRITVYI